MTTWEDNFIRFVADRWVFQGSDPHDFKPRVLFLAFGEDFLSPLLDDHRHHGALYSGKIGGRLIGYMRVPPGTVILEGIMRSLVMTRVDTVIGLGTCGGLQEDINRGDIVVAAAAEAGDSMSLHYGFNDGDVIEADATLSASIAGYLERKGLMAHLGPIVTTGAAFKETEELISSWNQRGYLGVELEASSQYALAHYMGLRTSMALLVTDSPLKNELWDVLRGRERDRYVEGIAGFIASPNLP